MREPTKSVESPTNNATPPSRTFLDADGAHWFVFEQAFGDYDRRNGMSLIFSNDAAVRRVRDYPADWIDLSDEDLAALSWRA